jgi:hypothetical protein
VAGLLSFPRLVELHFSKQDVELHFSKQDQGLEIDLKKGNEEVFGNVEWKKFLF